jgi:hypothetical protein
LSNKIIDLLFSCNWQDNLSINIVIPTFSRKENLLYLLNHLSNLNNSEIGIIVIDNDPDGHITESDIRIMLTQNIRFKLYKNHLHLGPDASVLRAMELATSNWIYLLGDSKIPDLTIINNFAMNIQNYNLFAAVVYSYDIKYKNNFVVNNLTELLNLDFKFGDILLGGNVIIKQNTFFTYYSIASQFTLARSILPIFIILSLNDSKKIIFKNDVLVNQTINKPFNYDPKLSLLECWAQFSLLLNLPINTSNLYNLNKFIIKNENFNSRLIFYKFILLKIFKDRIDISYNLKKILSYRYIFYINLIEYLIIYSLYIFSKTFNYIKNKISCIKTPLKK